MEEASMLLPDRGLGTLVFASGLNLLLFSPTYREPVREKIRHTLKNDRTNTYLSTVANNVLKDDIAVWEDAADNLLITRMEEPKRLFLTVSRLEMSPSSHRFVEVPISSEAFDEVKAVADRTRKKAIPLIRKI